MNPEHADAAVLAAAILTLVAITAKLVFSNLISRAKKNWGKLDYARRDIVGRLKKAQLARTSAKGTLEFWERRLSEAIQRLMDMERDLEAYAEQFADEDGEEGEEGAEVDTGKVATADDDEDGEAEVDGTSSDEQDEGAEEEPATESTGEDGAVADSGVTAPMPESTEAVIEPDTTASASEETPDDRA